MPTADVAAELNLTIKGVCRCVERGEIEPVFRAPGLRGAMFFRKVDVARLARQRAKAKAS
jgi:hypothetical protein